MKNPFIGLLRARATPRDAISSAPTFFFNSSTSGKTANPMKQVHAALKDIGIAVYAGIWQATPSAQNPPIQ